MIPGLTPEIARVLQSPELNLKQKMMAFNMLMPDLPADEKHNEAYEENIKTGITIIDMIKKDKLTIGKMNENGIIDFTTH